MEILDGLNNISPWWWVILAFALGSLEMATMSFFLIWPGLAALAMAGLLTMIPTLTPTQQIALFAVLSIVFTFVGRYLLRTYGDGGAQNEALNSRSAYLVGRSADVLDFDAGNGVVEIEGMRWRAQWNEGQTSKTGDSVRITKADAMLLYVEIKE